jgi:hypothetical protein
MAYQMKQITSEKLYDEWENDIYPEDLCGLHGTFKFVLSEGERGWLEFIGERYAIAKLIWDNHDENEQGDMVWTCDVSDVATALADDGVDRAPCLDEDTGLQRLIWYIGPREED